MVITKREDVTKQGLCKIVWKKTPSSGGSLIISYLSLSGSGCLLTFSAFTMGVYSRWARTRGRALIWINMVFWKLMHAWFKYALTSPTLWTLNSVHRIFLLFLQFDSTRDPHGFSFIRALNDLYENRETTNRLITAGPGSWYSEGNRYFSRTC